MKNKIWNYVIGDIHGCITELLELEEKIALHSEYNGVKPFIISVGDLIDRGPSSNLVIEHFRNGFLNGTHFVIMGNHEQMLLEALNNFNPIIFEMKECSYPYWLSTYKSNYESGRGMSRFLPWQDYLITSKSIWMSQGGFSTLISYDCDPYEPETWRLPSETLSFLLNLPFFWENNSSIVTHALAMSEDLIISKELDQKIKDGIKLTTEELISFKKSIHMLLWNRTPPKTRPHETKKHISGHTPTPNVKRFNKIACSQIDTSCVFGGKLTALCIETNTLISVKAKRNYLI